MGEETYAHLPSPRQEVPAEILYEEERIAKKHNEENAVRTWRKRRRFDRKFYVVDPDATVACHSYLAGKGKHVDKTSSARGRGRKRNPRGKDGIVMKCSKCGSEEHFIRDCPKTWQSIDM